MLEVAKTLKPDVIVADISMPGTDGLTAMTEVVRHALDAGASGFVLKVYAPTEFVKAIRTVVDGGTYVSSANAV